MTSLGAAQKSVCHTCAECSLKESRCSRMGNNSLSALLWKGKRDEVGVQAYPTVLSGGEGHGEAAVLSLHIPDLPAHCQNVAGFEQNIS